MYDGILADATWESVVTFQQLMFFSNQDGVVEMTPSAISRRTKIPIDIILRGIDFLVSGGEGKALLKQLANGQNWGWLIVNFTQYNDMMREYDRREYHRLYRKKRKDAQSANSAQPIQNRNKPQPEEPFAEYSPKAEEPSFQKPTMEELSDYCWDLGGTVNSMQFLDYYDSNGWYVDGKPMQDWKAEVRRWREMVLDHISSANQPI